MEKGDELRMLMTVYKRDGAYLQFILEEYLRLKEYEAESITKSADRLSKLSRDLFNI